MVGCHSDVCSSCVWLAHRRSDSLLAKALYAESHSPKIIVFFSSQDGFHNKLLDKFHDTKHKISSAGVAIGQLGLPHHGMRWVVFVRPVACPDPAPILDGLRVEFCVALSVLLDTVSAPLLEGWAELDRASKTTGKQTEEDSERGEKLNDLTDYGLLPKEATGLLSKGFEKVAGSVFDALGAARAELLLFWMRQQGAREGVVDLSRKHDPVHLDATLPDSRGKKLYVRESGKLAIVLSPYHVLSAFGYSPAVHNIAVASFSTAELVATKAIPFNVVFSGFLACAKVLRSS